MKGVYKMSSIQRRIDHFIDDEFDLSHEMAIIDSEFRKVVLTHIIANYGRS